MSHGQFQTRICLAHSQVKRYGKVSFLGFELGCLQARVHTKNKHKMILFGTYKTLMHHGDFLENSFWRNFFMHDGLYTNLSICYRIETYINDFLVQIFFFKIVKPWKNVTITTKGLKRTNFHMKLFGKCYKYKNYWHR